MNKTKRRTAPRIQEDTPRGVFLWMIELQRKGMLWHMDDCPVRGEIFEHALAMRLRTQWLRALKACDGVVDIHLLALTALDMSSAHDTAEWMKDTLELCRATGLTAEEVQRLILSTKQEEKRP